MKKILIFSICSLIYTGNTNGATHNNYNANSIFKQDPKSGGQPVESTKKKKKKNKKTEKTEMIDQKISISDENQPINKGKSKKTK